MDDITQRLENLERLIHEAAGEIALIRRAVDRLSRTGNDAQLQRMQAEIEGLRGALFHDVSVAYSARILADQSTKRGDHGR